MAVYTKTTWNEGLAPGISAVNLNNLETQYDVILTGANAYTGTGAGFRDEDNMASDDATATASQQSIKKYVDDEVAAEAATREFFVPVTFATDAIIALGNFPVARCDSVNEYGYMTFYVPGDFTAITEAVIIVIPGATQGAADWDTWASYGASGEAYTTHTANNVASTYNVTNNQLFEVDISGILAAVAADDYVSVSLEMSTAGHTAYVVGVRFKYS